MRILYLTMNPNRESTTVPTEGWFRVLRPCGLEPVLVSRTRGAFQTWAESEGVPCYDSDLPFPDKWRPWRFLPALAQVVAIGRRHRVDAVHSNEQDVYPFAQYVARLLGVPAVVSVHFTMGIEFCRWAFGGRRMPDRMVFVSASSLARCRPGIDIVPPSRRMVLYNGIDLDRFRPDPDLRASFRQAQGLTAADAAIGVACALRPRKQLDHLFQAAARVPNIRVLVAGGPVAGDEAYAHALIERGRALLGDRLVLLGHVTDLRPFYNGLDLFVNTSQEEACSISVIESLACGCPVIGYPSRSVDEQVLPGGGAIVEQDDPVALGEAIAEWVSSPDRLRASRGRARQRAAEAFDISRLSVQLWHEYERLITSRSPAAARTSPTRA